MVWSICDLTTFILSARYLIVLDEGIVAPLALISSMISNSRAIAEFELTLAGAG